MSAPFGAGFYQGSLLNGSVRREISDLNRLYLELALQAAAPTDAWFQLPAPAACLFAAACADTLERAAQCPVALFEVSLPEQVVARPGAVGDEALASAAEDAVAEARRAFGMTVLGVLRRLVEGVPLATRIAFGLEQPLETRLRTMSLSESFRVANWPGLIRPRWSDHDRYWRLLADAVTRGEGLHWAFTAGLCLTSPCERQPAMIAYAARRTPRPSHPRARPRRRDVPC